MSKSGLYLDDDNDGNYATLLSDGSIHFETITEIVKISEMIESIRIRKPDALVLDYRLDENKQLHKGENVYRAGSLAQGLREKALDDEDPASIVDFPIILVSSEDKISRFFNPDKTSHDLFDEWYRKESINDAEKRPFIINQISSLAAGYKNILPALNKPDAERIILGLSAEEAYVLEGTGIPYDIKDSKAPHIVSRIVLRNLIRNTGLLLRPADVAARLACDLSPNHAENEWLFSYFADQGCVYSGVFSDGWRRIWKHRFDVWADKIFGRPVIGVPGNERAAILKEKLGWSYSSSKSSWSGSDKELFAFACSCCRRPSELKHSITLHDERSLKYLERKRICYDCVRTGLYEEGYTPLRIAEEDANLAEEVMSLDRPAQ